MYPPVYDTSAVPLSLAMYTWRSKAERQEAGMLKRMQRKARPLLEPTHEIPDCVRLDVIAIPTRMKNALVRAGLGTVGDVRMADDSFIVLRRHIGRRSLAYIRTVLGTRSLTDLDS